jgi:hypothetical protein
VVKIDAWIERWDSKPCSIKGIGNELYVDPSRATAAARMPEIDTLRKKYGKTMRHPLDEAFIMVIHHSSLKSKASPMASFAAHFIEDLFTEYNIRSAILEVACGDPRPAIFVCREFTGWGVLIAPAIYDNEEMAKDGQWLPNEMVSALSRWG